NDNTTLDMDTYALSVSGAKDNQNAVILLGGANGFAIGTTGVAGGTITYDGGAQTIAAGSYYILRLEGTLAKSILTDTIVNTGSDVFVTSTVSLSLAAPTSLTTELNVGGNLDVDGTITNNGAITVGS
ncbi:MAG: hypothetical protein MUE68_13455, partial [Bacteroidetes bacterium]|nr:hypothetical protein [Bacteroidota bacterium]